MLKIPNCFDVINEENVETYRKMSGVWLMFGTNNDDGKIYCLNVGKEKNIGNELQRDFQRLKSFKKIKENEHAYVNQFGEKMFDYPVYADRLDYLYKEISNNYHDIFVIKIYDKSDGNVEKYSAYLFRAAYWVSNGLYKRNVSDKEIKTIRDLVNINHYGDKKQLLDLYDEYQKQL